MRCKFCGARMTESYMQENGPIATDILKWRCKGNTSHSFTVKVRHNDFDPNGDANIKAFWQETPVEPVDGSLQAWFSDYLKGKK